jgi:hypothetical protein
MKYRSPGGKWEFCPGDPAWQHNQPPNGCEVTFGDDPVGQLHSSLNGGSDEQGGMDELLVPPPAPPLDTDTPLDTDPLRDVETPLDP